MARPILGRSIIDEPNELFQRLQQLFTDQNKLVHRREKPIPAEQCKQDIHAGRDAVTWVLSFSPPRRLISRAHSTRTA